MQEGIKPFREHVAIVLHESVLNEIKGTPEYEKVAPNSDASNSDASNSDDLLIVEDLNKCPSPAHIMPTDPRELFDGLCKEIMSIQDDKDLE